MSEDNLPSTECSETRPGGSPPGMSAYNHNSDERDGALFRFWIRMAAEKPSKVVRILMRCTTPQQYRKALTELAQKERINLP